LVRTAEKKKMSFTDFLRVRFKGLLDPIGGFLNKIGLKPNTVTLLGLAGNLAAAYLLAIGQITWGGLVVMIMAPIDALDGTMARLRGKVTGFGGFVDSVTDRYSELLVFGGLLFYYSSQLLMTPVILCYLAAIGSLMVSYTRARAEALNYNAKVGLLTRVERYLVLIPCLIINKPLIALWILAILTNFTALQRIYSVRKQAYTIKDVID
jgi:CDP-diacylglycerol--glycerol-3-phosphate 3-phosphatidyltransferase